MSTVRREWSADPKREASVAIAHAQADLERAVAELSRLPALDVHAIALAAHALSSFLTVTGAVVDLLTPIMRAHPDRQVGIWLDGLAHATTLMSHTVSQLMNNSVSVPTTLRVDDVDVARLVERACAYYVRAANPKAVAIRFSDGPGLPIVRTDRVLVAAVVDSLLSTAIQNAASATDVRVELLAEADGIACVVRYRGQPPEPSAEYSLAVAHRFVALLGGAFTSERGDDQETTMTLRLPRLRASV